MHNIECETSIEKHWGEFCRYHVYFSNTNRRLMIAPDIHRLLKKMEGLQNDKKFREEIIISKQLSYCHALGSCPDVDSICEKKNFDKPAWKAYWISDPDY